ncbi:MAG TPA: MraY family glycosyltransferase [Chloroflexia bacterium]|nr:MraY family glycosyltransferase [Chloroflexia bacterium]
MDLTTNILTLSATGLIAFLVSFILTPVVKKFALRRGWAVPPSPRKIHKVPMVSIGGLAIFCGFVLAVGGVVLVSWMAGHYWRTIDLVHIGLLLTGCTLIAVVSLIDDVKDLSPRIRLLFQFLAALIVIIPQLIMPWHEYWGAIIDSIKLPGDINLPLLFLSIPFTIFWIMGMTNTVNWMDGLDGLAGGIVFIGAAILFLESIFVGRHSNDGIPLTSSMLALALACAILGFLPYNWNPAKIFMGDVGAMFLGYALAVISIIDGAKVAATLLVIGFPVLDVAWVITYRLLHKRSPFKPDRGHFHHRLLDLGLSQKQIVGIFYAVCGLFGAIGIFVQNTAIKTIGLIVLVMILLPLFFYAASRQTRAEIKASKLQQQAVASEMREDEKTQTGAPLRKD